MPSVKPHNASATERRTLGDITGSAIVATSHKSPPLFLRKKFRPLHLPAPANGQKSPKITVK